MVVGLVYSNLDGHSDPEKELAMVKQNLIQAIPSVAPVQTGGWNSTETVYANPNSGPFLSTIEKLLARTHALEKDFDALKKDSNARKKDSDALKKDSDALKTDFDALGRDSDALKKDSDALKKDSDALKKDSDALKRDFDALGRDSDALKRDFGVLRRDSDDLKQKYNAQEEELTMLRPLKDLAAGIRKRFFANFLEIGAQASGNIIMANSAVIDIGNQIAHGDVITDTCLIKNGIINYAGAFQRLYGVNWEKAGSLLSMPTNPSCHAEPLLLLTEVLIAFPHLVKVFNCRATYIANGGEDQLQDQLNELILWTQNATSQEIAIFNVDPDGTNNDHKRLYFRLINYFSLSRR